jgi:predicted O-methyltransferase YrrM
MDEIDRLLSRVKDRAHGYMPVAVYRRLYETAATAGGGTIVEIGTFRGAATIAMALGGRTVITADLLRDGVGLEGDGVAAKAASLRATLAEFGVEERVRFVHGDGEALVAAENPRDIALLLLDGGGRIESDFALLWDRLAPGAAIVIDDIDGRTRVERDLTFARINQKHLLSKLLAGIYMEAGMLVEEGRIGSTGWYRKGAAAPSPDAIRLMALPAYHRLIHIHVGAGEFGLPRALARWAAAKAPWLRRAYRRLRPER